MKLLESYVSAQAATYSGRSADIACQSGCCSLANEHCRARTKVKVFLQRDLQPGLSQCTAWRQRGPGQGFMADDKDYQAVTAREQTLCGWRQLLAVSGHHMITPKMQAELDLPVPR